jgi:hypothetical protein
MSITITPGVAAAIAGEILTASIRFYFLYKRMQVLQGMSEADAEAAYVKAKVEFEARPPEALEKLVESLGLK